MNKNPKQKAAMTEDWRHVFMDLLESKITSPDREKVLILPLNHFYFLFGHALRHWELGVLTTGPPGKSLLEIFEARGE